MDQIIDIVGSHLIEYMCNELVELIISYLVKFNTETLFFE
jgi:hypothetical protein